MFDLDGTLVQSEKLKALSYAIAAQRLRQLSDPDPKAIEAYREIVGASRDVASSHIMDALELEALLRPVMDQHGVTQPVEVLTAMRKEIRRYGIRPPGPQGQPVASHGGPFAYGQRGRLPHRPGDHVLP